jgi:glycerol-1-phosphate dehydrogenase [NAD(P)+]
MPNRLLSEPFEKALDLFPRLADCDPTAVTELFRLLLVSGISMSITGTSSPASGGEHLISHYWDMTRLRDGLPINLHGAQVGVGSLLADDLYGEICDLDFSSADFEPSPPLEHASEEIDRIFGSLAGAVWPQWETKLVDRSAADLERMVEHQAAIRAEIEATVITGRKVRSALTEAGAPISAGQLGVSASELEAAIRHGRKIRTRFTVLDVAAELGILDSFADRVRDRGRSR